MNSLLADAVSLDPKALDQSKTSVFVSLLTWLRTFHHILYCVGVRIIRYARRISSKTKKAMLRFKWFLKRKLYDWKESLLGTSSHSLSSRIHRRLTAPWQKTKENLVRRKQPNAPHMSLSAALSPLFKSFAGTLSYILPIASLVFLGLTIQEFSSKTYALRVEYNGEYIGYVLNEGEFAKAEGEVRSRLVNEAYLPPEDSTPIYTMEAVQEDQLSDQTLLVNNIIEASGNQFQEASGLYVDGKFIGAVAEGDQLLMDLKSLKDQERMKQGLDSNVSFVQPVRLEKGLYPVSSVAELDSISQELNKEVKAEIVYTIQEGDSPSLIADKFDVPTKTLLALNPEVSQSMLVGAPFRIEANQLFLQRKVVKTVTEEQEIAFKTETEHNKNKDKSYNKVVQEGFNGLTRITSEIVYIDGYETERNVVSKKVIREPVNAKVVVGSLSTSAYNFSDSGVSGGKNIGGYIRPVNTGYISEPIWGYPNHTGTDIATSSGTPIFASKSGSVAYSGWSNGYGYNVLINHPDGTRTRYAHCSSLATYAGKTVSQGEVIGYVGRTGNATGNHVHFEIISNGTYLDARKYIGR